MTATIEVNDVCAVEHVSIPIPENGGVVVLKGANGTGKSSILKGVERLASGKKDITLTPRDGVQRGEIAGCGVTLRVSRSITRTGELESEILDGKLSVAELVDPGLKGEMEADAKRIRALVQLSGVKPEVSLFETLLEDQKQFQEVVKGKNLETDDILVLADRIKRAIDEAARNAEGVANTEKAKAAACREASTGIDTAVETDDERLQEALEAAIRHEQDLIARADEASRRNAEILDARDQIEAAKTRASGDSTFDILRRLSNAEEAMLTARSLVDAKNKKLHEAIASINAEIKEADHLFAVADEKWNSITRELTNAERFETAIAELQSTVAAGEIVGPTADALTAAEQSVDTCRKSIEAGVLARRAVEQITKSKLHAKAETDAATKAETLREAAKRVDDVLSEQIQKLGVPLQVKSGRLVTTTSRGTTLYADLSDGERWKIALDIAIEAVGPTGMLYIPQAAWEALDPHNRQLVVDRVTGRGVVILTAEASSGELRAEIQPETPPY